QAADFGAAGGGAEYQRTFVDRLFEELANRLAVDQCEILFLEPEHRRAAGRVIGIERIACVPRRLATQFVPNTLLAKCEPDLAAERTEGEVIELPHGPSLSCRKARAASMGLRADYS